MWKWMLVGAAIWMQSFPAAAAVMQATYSGTLLSGFDSIGYFDTGSHDLTGQRVRLSVKYNTSVPGALRDTRSNYDYLFGGNDPNNDPIHGPYPAVASAQLLINGQSFFLAGNYSGTAFRFNNGYYANAQNEVLEYFVDPTTGAISDFYVQLYALDILAKLPINLETAYSFDANASPDAFFQHYSMIDIDYVAINDPQKSYSLQGIFYADNVKISPVPIPASAALFAFAVCLLIGVGRKPIRREPHL